MIRRYFLLGLITLLFSASTFAQYEQTGGLARLRGMGNNPYIVDPYFMTVNPGWAGFYQNFLFGDLGSSAGAFSSGGVGQFIGANFHLGGGLSLGALLTRGDFNGFSIANPDPFSRFNGAPQTGGVPFGVVNILNSLGVPPAVALNNNLELLGSFKSGNTAFGFGISYASSTNETTTAGTGGGTSTSSASQIGFNAGIVTKLTSSFMLDAGSSLIMPSATFEPATGNSSEASQTIILANARIFWQYSSKLSFVPSVQFITASGTVDNGTTATSTSTDLPSFTVLIFGIGANYAVGDFLLAGGPGLATISSTISSTPTTPELSTSLFAFPVWNLGVEWNLTDWLVGRFGYVASTQNITTESNATQTTETGDVNETIVTSFLPVGATLGVGFRLGNFSIDATVNEDVLRQGLNNIGGGGSVAGATNNGATFAYLSLSYSMP